MRSRSNCGGDMANMHKIQDSHRHEGSDKCAEPDKGKDNRRLGKPRLLLSDVM